MHGNDPPLRLIHNHHLLAVKGCESALDVLAFEGDEALSTPFRYLRSVLATCVDHQEAYDVSSLDDIQAKPALQFTLGAIVKMVQEIPNP